MHGTTEAEFRAFVTARWPRLLGTAYLLTGHHHDAEDLVQTALARAFSRWERVTRADNADAYVWRIMINLHRDRARRADVREWLTGWLPDRPGGSDSGDRVATRSTVVDALARLPSRQRAVVVLRYLEDLSEGEVATLMGTGVGTVRSQAGRALARLRQDGALREAVAETSVRS